MFTFGAGGYGQLGHNTINHEVNPRKVFELMGNVVTQVACGRYVYFFLLKPAPKMQTQVTVKFINIWTKYCVLLENLSVFSS